MGALNSASDRLLEGENPETTEARDARHWIAVYRDMINFKVDLLDRVRAQLASLPAAGVRDIIEHDITLIEAQLERYQRRMEFWYPRHWELEGLQISDPTRTITYRDRSVRLTRREHQIFSFLAAGIPRYFTAAQLLAEAWHDPRLPEETMRTYIVRLRSKLRQLDVGAEIVNRPRRGYALLFTEPNSRVS